MLFTTPAMQSTTETSFDNVNLSPLDEGKNAARMSVKKVEVELISVTTAASLGSSANWNK